MGDYGRQAGSPLCATSKASTYLGSPDGTPDLVRFPSSTKKHLSGVCAHEFRQVILAKDLAQCPAKDLIRDTLLHEMAHAVCKPAKPGEPGHGPDFVREIKRLVERGETRLRAEAVFYAIPFQKRRLLGTDAICTIQEELDCGWRPTTAAATLRLFDL